MFAQLAFVRRNRNKFKFTSHNQQQTDLFGSRFVPEVHVHVNADGLTRFDELAKTVL